MHGGSDQHTFPPPLAPPLAPPLPPPLPAPTGSPYDGAGDYLDALDPVPLDPVPHEAAIDYYPDHWMAAKLFGLVILFATAALVLGAAWWAITELVQPLPYTDPSP